MVPAIPIAINHSYSGASGEGRSQVAQQLDGLSHLVIRPRAQVAIKNAGKQLKAILSRWETAYNKQNFYRGMDQTNEGRISPALVAL